MAADRAAVDRRRLVPGFAVAARRRLLTAALVAVLVGLLAGCTGANRVDIPAPTSGPGSTGATAGTDPTVTGSDPSSDDRPPLDLVPAAIPADDATAVIALFSDLNAAAGGRIADQQADFVDRMATGSAEAQRECRAATVTVRFRPVWQELRADPEFVPPNPGATGTAYRIPASVEIFAGSRRVGTDLTMVHIRVDGDRASTFPLCLS